LLLGITHSKIHHFNYPTLEINMKKLIPFLVSGVLAVGMVGCQEAPKTGSETTGTSTTTPVVPGKPDSDTNRIIDNSPTTPTATPMTISTPTPTSTPTATSKSTTGVKGVKVEASAKTEKKP
jgi:hyperosmotically inducible protein